MRHSFLLSLLLTTDLKKTGKVSTTIGIYNGHMGRSSWKVNGVLEANLEEHIEYNRQWRPGRALFVDGKCVLEGSLNAEEISRFESDLVENPIVFNRDTQPYH